MNAAMLLKLLHQPGAGTDQGVAIVECLLCGVIPLNEVVLSSIGETFVAVL